MANKEVQTNMQHNWKLQNKIDWMQNISYIGGKNPKRDWIQNTDRRLNQYLLLTPIPTCLLYKLVSC